MIAESNLATTARGACTPKLPAASKRLFCERGVEHTFGHTERGTARGNLYLRKELFISTALSVSTARSENMTPQSFFATPTAETAVFLVITHLPGLQESMFVAKL